ncbi:PREDICTED: uncharacterized protein LOC102812546 [Chrysochloris asiatica]|uniref:Uncharacterized protein LOC102812546 n=1 Tax=Chrysochloris asiatica TaxID=185453 RepID=A0A9B0TUJ0_CHRAS|nr:PREDICTED: uncharacterized protein LOC102812546 [Chrysochloris asiatica]
MHSASSGPLYAADGEEASRGYRSASFSPLSSNKCAQVVWSVKRLNRGWESRTEEDRQGERERQGKSAERQERVGQEAEQEERASGREAEVRWTPSPWAQPTSDPEPCVVDTRSKTQPSPVPTRQRIQAFLPSGEPAAAGASGHWGQTEQRQRSRTLRVKAGDLGRGGGRLPGVGTEGVCERASIKTYKSAFLYIGQRRAFASEGAQGGRGGGGGGADAGGRAPGLGFSSMN